MDSAAASRGESPLPSVSFPSPVRVPPLPKRSPVSFLSRSRPRTRTRVSLRGGSSAMRPRCGRSCHCSGDRYPSSRLRVKVTTLYLESQLMPPPLSRDHPLIIDEPPSATVLTQLLRNLSPTPATLRYPCSPSLSLSLSLSFSLEEEEEARTSGKPKSAIPITGTIYRLRAVLVSYLSIGQRCHHRFPSLRSDRTRTIAPSSRRSPAGDFSGKILPARPSVDSLNAIDPRRCFCLSNITRGIMKARSGPKLR